MQPLGETAVIAASYLIKIWSDFTTSSARSHHAAAWLDCCDCCLKRVQDLERFHLDYCSLS
eukprot:868712-Rhodomonas_salina.1